MEVVDIYHFSAIDALKELNLYPDACDDFVVEHELGEDRIVVSGPFYRLCGTNLVVAEGVYYRYDEDSDSLEQDFDVALLYESSGEPDAEKPLFWEQGDIVSMFHSYVVSHEHDLVPVEIFEKCVA